MLRLCTKDEMQGAEDEVEGSVLTYVTETEFRKQRSRSPSCNSRSIGIGHPRSGDRCAKTRPYPLDPWWVAEQKSPSPCDPQGVGVRTSICPQVFVAVAARPVARKPGSLAGSITYREGDRCGKEGTPCRGATQPSISQRPIRRSTPTGVPFS